ncbi:hypothetical protein AX15_001019 [Amanita polypyramis BW_CC]|nr:hypothetical protein AX15_001019 [Amanita polypyramis BW_CC]
MLHHLQYDALSCLDRVPLRNIDFVAEVKTAVDRQMVVDKYPERIVPGMVFVYDRGRIRRWNDGKSWGFVRHKRLMGMDCTLFHGCNDHGLENIIRVNVRGIYYDDYEFGVIIYLEDKSVHPSLEETTRQVADEIKKWTGQFQESLIGILKELDAPSKMSFDYICDHDPSLQASSPLETLLGCLERISLDDINPISEVASAVEKGNLVSVNVSPEPGKVYVFYNGERPNDGKEWSISKTRKIGTYSAILYHDLPDNIIKIKIHQVTYGSRVYGILIYRRDEKSHGTPIELFLDWIKYLAKAVHDVSVKTVADKVIQHVFTGLTCGEH